MNFGIPDFAKPNYNGKQKKAKEVGVMRAIVMLLVLVAPAFAEDRGKAKELFEDASRRYALGEYHAALGRFKTAYDNFADPIFLFNIAQCYRAMDDKAQAVTIYRSYLREMPNAANANDVRKLIVVLDADLLRERESKQRPPQGIEPPADRAPPAIRKTPPPRWRNPGGWSALGAGVLVGALGAGLAGGSIAIEADARAASTLPRELELQQRAQRMEIAGWTFVGIGAAAVVAGVVFLATNARAR
jgi:hypothetical protein